MCKKINDWNDLISVFKVRLEKAVNEDKRHDLENSIRLFEDMAEHDEPWIGEFNASTYPEFEQP
jgi:hypothetical protein